MTATPRFKETEETGAKLRQIRGCRISGSSNLVKILSLGEQKLTGVFPKSPDQMMVSGPLDLVWCPDTGLLQLLHSYDPAELYGDNYGYRSGLNQSMVRHLVAKAHELETRFHLRASDVVLDIGSNDGTLLKAYQTRKIKRIGMDPTGAKFREFYPDDITLRPTFFSASEYRRVSDRPAKIITSIAMFYDLEDPVQFAREIFDILADDGVWHLEQSYMPWMLRTGAYDTICHEHIEYYSLDVINRILKQIGMVLLDVRTNSVNGGSFAVTAGKQGGTITPNSVLIDWMLEQERQMNLDTMRPYEAFERKVRSHRDNFRQLIHNLRDQGKKIVGYGASTKGNVLLQYCGLTNNDIIAIAEVNEDKFGSYTPGTLIPIISETEARSIRPDYLLALPWHFRDGILQREAEFLANGGKIIFPLPEIEIF